MSEEEQEGWRGFFDGLTDPYAKTYEVSLHSSTHYVQGVTAGVSAYWRARDAWLREVTDEPF